MAMPWLCLCSTNRGIDRDVTDWDGMTALDLAHWLPTDSYIVHLLQGVS